MLIHEMIKSTLWHGSQVLQNQSHNLLLCSCYQISLSIKSIILFSKLISVCDSAIRPVPLLCASSFRLQQCSTSFRCLFSTKIAKQLIKIYKKNPIKSKNVKTHSLSNCYIWNNAINKPTLWKCIVLKINKKPDKVSVWLTDSAWKFTVGSEN